MMGLDNPDGLGEKVADLSWIQVIRALFPSTSRWSSPEKCQVCQCLDYRDFVNRDTSSYAAV